MLHFNTLCFHFHALQQDLLHPCSATYVCCCAMPLDSSAAGVLHPCALKHQGLIPGTCGEMRRLYHLGYLMDLEQTRFNMGHLCGRESVRTSFTRPEYTRQLADREFLTKYNAMRSATQHTWSSIKSPSKALLKWHYCRLALWVSHLSQNPYHKSSNLSQNPYHKSLSPYWCSVSHAASSSQTLIFWKILKRSMDPCVPTYQSFMEPTYHSKNKNNLTYSRPNFNSNRC